MALASRPFQDILQATFITIVVIAQDNFFVSPAWYKLPQTNSNQIGDLAITANILSAISIWNLVFNYQRSLPRSSLPGMG
jgi:hypothetical protein